LKGRSYLCGGFDLNVEISDCDRVMAIGYSFDRSEEQY
jgi:hypothetical protein